MSRRQDVQSAEGIALRFPTYGTLQYISKSPPAGGEVGFAPGCEWFVPTGTAAVNTGIMYTNIGSNGYGSNKTATWIESDPSSGQSVQFGGSTAAFLASGNLYRTILTTANGISPSATGALKIVDVYTLPANAFNAVGRGIQFTVWANNTGTSGHAVRIQIVANPSNSGLPASGSGVAGKTDGTLTVTGGTVVLDTGSSYSPTGTVTFGIAFSGQIFKAGVAGSNTQESLVTSVLPSAGLTHTSNWADQTLTESSANVFAVCVSAATTAADIVFQGTEITAFN